MVVVRQLRLLIWKNWLLQIRRPIGSVAEFLLPILLIAALAGLRTVSKPEHKCFETCKDANLVVSSTSILQNAQPTSASTQGPRYNTILYYPSNPVTTRIMETARCLSSSSGDSLPFAIKPVNSKAAMDVDVLDATQSNLGGVVFEDMTDDASTKLPPKLSYTLRLRTDSSRRTAGTSKVATWLTALRVPAFSDAGIIEQVNHDGLTQPLMYVIDQAFTRIQVEHAEAATGDPVSLCTEASSCRGVRVTAVDGTPLNGTNITCAIRHSSAPGDTRTPCCELDLDDPNKQKCNCKREISDFNTPSNVSCECALLSSVPRCSCNDTLGVAGLFSFYQASCGDQAQGFTVGFNRLCCGLCASTVRSNTNGSVGLIANSTYVPILTRHMPTKEFTEESFIPIISTVFPIITVLIFSYTVYSVTQELIKEKQSRLKESLRMMGCRNWVIWLSWFLKYFVQFILISLFITLILKFGKITPDADFLVIYILFLLYCHAMLVSCSFWSTLFSNPTVGALVATVMFLVSVVPAFIFSGSTTVDPQIKNGFCAPFFLNTCLTYSVVLILQQGSRGVTVSFSNLSDGLDQFNTFNLQSAYLLILAQIAFFWVMTWYIEAVFPGEYGVPKKFYFFLQPSYWFGFPDGESDDYHEKELLKGNDQSADSSAFEPEPTGVKFGIRIDNLQKVFRGLQGTKVAVDGLTLNMVEGQITSLLGHNGAGKTTTMSMLTGLYNPTGGNAYINGKSILTEMDQIRGDLGLCPQHNVLWDKLTVNEHLVLFASLKGLSGSLLNMAVADMLDDLKLRDKTTWKSMQLSGGMKRKLSVGIALVGGSKVVIFDEPTAGMDPYARRATWDLLIKHKKDRTILLTTHYMDEADLLGDRIAIMADGQCKCVGSSLFLKSRYGVGYHLTVAKGSQCDENRVASFIVKSIPNGRMVSSVGAEMAFILPSEATGSFPQLFEDMEVQKEQLGIDNFGLSVTTMEEVFIRVGQLAEEEKEKERLDAEKGDDAHANGLIEKDKARKLNDYELLTGPALWFQRLYALLIKRLTVVHRSYFVITIQLFVPLLALIGGLSLLTTTSSSGSGEPAIQFGVPYFKGSAANLITLRTADFRRSNERDLNLPTAVQSVARAQGIEHSDLTAAVDATRSLHNKTVSCCAQSYLVLNEECMRLIQQNPSMCGGDPLYAFNRCPTCVFLNTEMPLKSPNTQLNFLPRSDGAAFGTCGRGATACPASPLDLQSSFTGYLQQYFLETGSLSRSVQDSLPATFSFHTMVADESEAYSHYNLYQRDPPVSCLGTTSSGVRQGTGDTLYSTRANSTYCATLSEQAMENPFYVRLWSWGQDYHSGPSALNTFSNVWLEAVLRSRVRSSQSWTVGTYGIKAALLPIVPASDEATQLAGNSATLTFGLVFGIGLSFMLASFVIFPLTEKKNKAKHIQFVSGVGPVSYWLANYIADVITYVVVWSLLAIVVAVYGTSYATIKAVLNDTIYVLFFGGLSSISFAYFAALFFKSPVLSFAAIGIMLFILTLAGTIASYVLEALRMFETASIVRIACSVLPPFAMSNGVGNLYLNEELGAVCRRQVNASAPIELLNNCYNVTNYTDTPFGTEHKGIGYNLLFSYALAGGLLLLVMIVEQGWMGRLFGVCFSPRKPAQTTKNEDNDVAEERRKVQSLDPKREKLALVAKNLTKSYRGKLVRPSSDHICLSVPQGECFGLLGVNGAGKTTTFNMLTGEVAPSSGDAYILGHSIRSQLSQVQQRVGYCPQFDALIEKMNSYELLTMFARLRGIPPNKIQSVVDNLIEELDLKKWASRLCGTYSGGNKRKLSTAIALVGNPPLIFLDEPTAGMDPAARRFLWDFLTKILNSGRSIVMTSHSMEECEALCTRLAIMVNGQFKCLGSLQHIKTKFGQGFNLMAKVQPPEDGSEKEPDTGPLKRLMKANFPNHEIEDEHFGQVQFRINQNTDGVPITWSSIFRIMEDNRGVLNIIDYSLSQTTLEQVFLKFAKKQTAQDS
ncbi:phospholipid-transporting ATPase ABCA3-like [Sycon ciliatum]|uniref:phospholipid-transporting ATPase ABCA3-like n=1 Tax=Sycon ciliatum TaxID=27933 RepID=UPI0031F6249C